jgi:hypothetical protein
MPRTSAKFTQADLIRAAKAAAAVGYRVRLVSSGELVIEAGQQSISDLPLVDTKREIRL